MQIFVSDERYVYVVPMNSPKESPTTLKMFAKEVEVPEAVIADSHLCNKSQEVKQCCHNIGTAMRILEGSTRWANRAELYAWLFKETV